MLGPLLAQSNPRSFIRHSIDGHLPDLLRRDGNSSRLPTERLTRAGLDLSLLITLFPEVSRVVVDIHRGL